MQQHGPWQIVQSQEVYRDPWIAVRKDDVIRPDGRIDIIKIRPLARLGYYDYTSVESIFEMVIPGENETLLAGLEGKRNK